jgi:hypothetical protein
VKDAKAELQRPFTQEAELAQKETRLARLNNELDIDGMGGEAYDGDDPQTEIAGVLDDDDYGASGYTPRDSSRQAGKQKPSILDGIQTFNADIKAPTVPGKDRPNQTTI